MLVKPGGNAYFQAFGFSNSVQVWRDVVPRTGTGGVGAGAGWGGTSCAGRTRVNTTALKIAALPAHCGGVDQRRQAAPGDGQFLVVEPRCEAGRRMTSVMHGARTRESLVLALVHPHRCRPAVATTQAPPSTPLECSNSSSRVPTAKTCACSCASCATQT